MKGLHSVRVKPEKKKNWGWGKLKQAFFFSTEDSSEVIADVCWTWEAEISAHFVSASVLPPSAVSARPSELKKQFTIDLELQVTGDHD